MAPGYIPRMRFEEAMHAVRNGRTWRRRTHGTPQDMAELVGWLSTEAARLVNGVIISIDGAPEAA